MAKICALCGQETIPKQVTLPAACWQCTLYFVHRPGRALLLYDKVTTPVKKRLLKALMPEEAEEDLNERKSIRVGRSVVRERPYRALKPANR
jgi:hypothetical protein